MLSLPWLETGDFSLISGLSRTSRVLDFLGQGEGAVERWLRWEKRQHGGPHCPHQDRLFTGSLVEEVKGVHDMPQGTEQQGGAPGSLTNEGAWTCICSNIETNENLTVLSREGAASKREGITTFLVESHLDSHFLSSPLALTLEVKHQKGGEGRVYRIEHSRLQIPPTPTSLLRATRNRLACLSLEGREDKWF